MYDSEWKGQGKKTAAGDKSKGQLPPQVRGSSSALHLWLLLKGSCPEVSGDGAEWHWLNNPESDKQQTSGVNGYLNLESWGQCFLCGQARPAELSSSFVSIIPQRTGFLANFNSHAWASLHSLCVNTSKCDHMHSVSNGHGMKVCVCLIYVYHLGATRRK